MFAHMQLRDLYNIFLKELKPLFGYGESSAISTMIFEHFAKKSKADIITDPNYTISPDQMTELENALLQLKRQVPVQYIIGHAWFAGLQFKVSPAVLIPRPETEELVKEAIHFITTNHKHSLLDIGTGSGCIPIVIKKHLPALEVTALDVSQDALGIAAENAAIHHVSIDWIQTDFLQDEKWQNFPVYDVIISNPPYIPQREKELLDANVLAHEPHLALFVPDNDAIIFYEKIASFGMKHLSAGGSIFMETHESFAQKVADHFLANGYNALIRKDFFDKERMVIASRSH